MEIPLSEPMSLGSAGKALRLETFHFAFVASKMTTENPRRVWDIKLWPLVLQNGLA